MRNLAIPLALLLATACLGPGDGKCINGAQRRGERCVLTNDDASSVSDASDSSQDAGHSNNDDSGIHPYDAGKGTDGGGNEDASMPTCNSVDECDADAPLCTDRACSACKENTDCDRFASIALPACGTKGSCVECSSNEHCLDPLQPVCGDDNLCEAACTSDLDCQRTSPTWTTPYCETNKAKCVGCTPGALEAAQCANGNACDPIAMACTGKPRKSVATCNQCITDTECATGLNCVEAKFQNASHGWYCLLRMDAGLCPDRFALRKQARSISGVDAPFCFPREDDATCEAVLDFQNPCDSASDCGAEGVDDGLCIDLGGGKRCTYACNGNADCGAESCVTVSKSYCDPN